MEFGSKLSSPIHQERARWSRAPSNVRVELNERRVVHRLRVLPVRADLAPYS